MVKLSLDPNINVTQQFNLSDVENSFALPVIFSHVMFWPVIILVAFYYLRVKILTNIRNVNIPLRHKSAYIDWYRSWSRKEWIIRSVLLLIFFPIGLNWSHIYVLRLARFYEMEDGGIGIFLLSFTQVIATSGIAFIFVQYLVIAEKAIRHFDDLKKQLDDLSHKISTKKQGETIT